MTTVFLLLLICKAVLFTNYTIFFSVEVCIELTKIYGSVICMCVDNLKNDRNPIYLTITSPTIQIVFQSKEIDTLKKTTGKYIMLKKTNQLIQYEYRK